MKHHPHHHPHHRPHPKPEPQLPAPQPSAPAQLEQPTPQAKAKPRNPRVAEVLSSALIVQRTEDGKAWAVTLRQQLVDGTEHVEGGKSMTRRHALTEYARLHKKLSDTITRWGGTPNG